MNVIKGKTSFPVTIVLLLLASMFTVNNTLARHSITNAEEDTLSETVLIHPMIEATEKTEFIASREHTYKEHLRLGDQLGRDFIVGSLTEKGTMEIYANDGRTNEDYFGWRKNVLAPIDGTVTEVNQPQKTNEPGNMDRESEPGRIIINNENGITVMLVHIREISVEEGDTVNAGEVIAKVGNNGISRAPHVHVGAWKDETPLQIQVDLYADKRDRYAKEEADSE